jgi:tartrate dehydrogenase/decarboxylase / D-malate dehydrogenase
VKHHKIAVIPGDGIGVDVIQATLPILQKTAEMFGFSLDQQIFDWSCNYFLKHGQMMPDDGIDTIRAFDAILLGAVGWPARVPDDVSLHGLLLPLRKELDLYVNSRHHKLLPGVAGPLRAEKFDILCIRENTEGEYSGAGGRIHRGTKDEVAVETSIFTRRGVERILRYGFEQARKRSGRLASVTKSNAQKHSMVFWDEVTEEVSAEYPDVAVTRYHIDAIAARFVMQPESLDVVVASNLFGDILTDIGAAIQGGLGYAASANLNPDQRVPSMFEPVHGSAPDIAGQGIANPIAAIWSSALMLRHLGEEAAAKAILEAIAAATASLAQTNANAAPTTEEISERISAGLRQS